MPYTVDWYIENEIIYTRYSSVTTTEELRESLVKSKALMDSSPRPLVHSIIDVGDVVEAVALKDSLSVVREVGTHPRAGWSITIREESMLVKMAAAMGSSLFRLRYRSFSTLDEAIALLKEMDQTISWDKATPSVVAQLTQHSDTYPRKAS